MTEDFVFNIKSLPLIFIRVLPLQKGEKKHSPHLNPLPKGEETKHIKLSVLVEKLNPQVINEFASIFRQEREKATRKTFIFEC